jgi:hypothetical protein
MYYADIIIDRVPVKSKNVASLGYHDKYNIMAIEMMNGKIYYYLDIPKTHFNQMTNPPRDYACYKSIGHYLYENIKGKYRFVVIN